MQERTRFAFWFSTSLLNIRQWMNPSSKELFHFLLVNRYRRTRAWLLPQPTLIIGHICPMFRTLFCAILPQLFCTRVSHIVHESPDHQAIFYLTSNSTSSLRSFLLKVWQKKGFPGNTVNTANLIFFLRGKLVASQNFWIGSCLQ